VTKIIYRNDTYHDWITRFKESLQQILK